MTDFDFDDWAALARSDPDAFESRRREAIQSIIDGAPVEQQARLRGLQFRIDLERSRSTTALSACIRLNRLMWDQFALLRESLDELLVELSGHSDRVPRPMPPSAEVLVFPGAR